MIRELENYSLLQHNTFGIDVTAKHFIEYETLEELQEVISSGRINKAFLHIGGGSNLLFIDDYQGTILHSAIKGIEVIQETPEFVFLKVGSGVVWDDFVAYCVQNNLYGAENLSDIPGEVGASAVQNIGAYGVEAKDIIASVSTIDKNGREKIYWSQECEFSYRHSIFKKSGMNHTFVTYVNYKLSKKPHYTLDYGTVREELNNYPEITLQAVRQTIINIRSAKLPDTKTLGNAGSFFMNPVISKHRFEKLQELYPEIPYYIMNDDMVKIPAAWLIEQTGWKGKSLGPAAVYNKQALILVNTGGATGKDIMALSTAVQKAVKEKFDIDINPEVKMVL